MSKRATAHRWPGPDLLSMADFGSVTETPDVGITREALSMAYTRYAFAGLLCQDKRVLEAACGVGQGLGLLARRAAWLVGGDFSGALIERARAHYRGRTPLVRFDAQALPFANRSFDVVILYEAIYYLRQAELFIAEARRVLDEHGSLIICSANPERPDFNPSPMSVRYFSARELLAALQEQGFQAAAYGAFPIDAASLRARLISALRRAAVALNLMPKTMKGKEALKRVFFGPLRPAPAEIADGMASYSEPVLITGADQGRGYKVLFGVGRRT